MINPTLIQQLSNAVFLGMVVGIPCYAQWKKIPAFDHFAEGASHGFEVVLKILPNFIGIYVAIGMMRAAGIFEWLSQALGPSLEHLGVPSAVLPLMLVRPFSGSTTNAVLADIVHSQGGNAYVSKLAAMMAGSTETTFYVVAVYFGAVSITRVRYAPIVGLLADLSGFIASLVIAALVFGKP